ncbi:MAG: universal stress protein [Eubacteriales bacterium]
MTEKTRVLLPSDGSDTSLKAAAYAARLMKLNPQKQVTVLVVIPAGREFLSASKQSDGFFQKLDEAMEVKAKEALNKTVDIFRKEGLTITSMLEKGDPAQKILDYAGQGDYDHIIMGSRGVSELRGAALGSVSHKVINQAECRVTLVK